MKRKWRTALEIAALFAVGCALLVFFGAETPKTDTPGAGSQGITALSLQVRRSGSIRVDLVYARDPWAETAAEKMYIFLGTRDAFPILVDIMPDSEYSGETDADLTVFLGHTVQWKEDYLTAYERLGPDGLEITHGEDAAGNTDRLYILAFREEQLERGIQKFQSYFLSASRLYRAFNVLYMTEKGKTPAVLPTQIAAEGTEYTFAVLSYPGTDSYSTAALDGLLAQAAPEEILFNGGLACETGRDALQKGWQTILATVQKTGAAVRFLPMTETTDGEEGVIAADVIRSVLPEADVLTESRCVMLTDKNRTPLGLVFLLASDSAETAEADAAMIGQMTALAGRAAGKTVPAAVIMPALSPQCAAMLPPGAGDTVRSGAVINEPTVTYVRSYADMPYTAARDAGIGTFVFQCGYTNTGVFLREEGDARQYFALCGSLDFNAPGMGGKFALHNSLRGLVSLTFDFSGEGEVRSAYLYARDYGLTVKNVG